MSNVFGVLLGNLALWLAILGIAAGVVVAIVVHLVHRSNEAKRPGNGYEGPWLS
jgi:hypothetical protein